MTMERDSLVARLERVRHKNRGSEYEVIGIGKMQAEHWIDQRWTRQPESGEPPKPSWSRVDLREVVVYRSLDDGSLWVRSREEFEDGRFEVLASAPASPAIGVQAVTDGLLDEMAKNIGLELSWGEVSDFEGEPCQWMVHERTGNRSDREWHLRGVGDTPRAALQAALHPAPEAASEGAAGEVEAEGVLQAVERAYGILWRDVSRGSAEKSIAARKELLAVLTKDGQRRGIAYAVDRYGSVSDTEIVEVGDECMWAQKPCTCGGGPCEQVDFGSDDTALPHPDAATPSDTAPSPKGVSDGVRAAFENVDDEDWRRLFLMLPDSGYGSFWKQVLSEIRAALSQEPVPATAEERAASKEGA